MKTNVLYKVYLLGLFEYNSCLARKLDFENPRTEDFPALNLARQAGNSGGTLPAVMNAANEIAVAQFLQGQLSFPGIWEHVGSIMNDHNVIENPSIDELIEADRWARSFPIV